MFLHSRSSSSVSRYTAARVLIDVLTADHSVTEVIVVVVAAAAVVVVVVDH